MIRVSELKLPVTGNQKALEKSWQRHCACLWRKSRRTAFFKRSLDARKKDNIH